MLSRATLSTIGLRGNGKFTGSHEDNPAFDLPSREIVARGQKKIEIIGPVADEALREEIIAVHRGYWK